MSKSTKVHHYHRTQRSVCLVGANLCQDKLYFYPVPPQDALTIETLYVHIKITFDSSVDAGSRVLQAVGIGSEHPLFIDEEPEYYRELELNQSADGNRVVEVRLDLTSLLNKTNIRYRAYFDNISSKDFTYVVIKLSESLRGVINVGVLNKCKVDTQYTTKKIA